jgi:uncharacterized membrane protein YkvA (DUF1232 family)
MAHSWIAGPQPSQAVDGRLAAHAEKHNMEGMNAWTEPPTSMTLPVAASAPPSKRRFWAKLRRVLARIPFSEDLLAAYYCAFDPDTPAYVRAVLFGAIAYFVLPTDMVPDFLVGLGFTDDASVLAAAIAAVGSHIAPRHRVQARASLARLAG